MTLATFDRDPADPAALAAAAAAWIRAQTDEADTAFEAALLEQGVISPIDLEFGLTFSGDWYLGHVRILVDGIVPMVLVVDTVLGTVAVE